MKFTSSIGEIYQNLLKETNVFDYVENVIEWTKSCEEKKMIQDLGKDVHLICCKTKYPENKTSVRFLFIIKDKIRGRVRNLEKIVHLIACVEKSLDYLDTCKHKRYDNLIYLDITKEI